MSFESLGWFPTATSSYLEGAVIPVSLEDRYLYPGDTFVAPDGSTAYAVLGTGLGPMNDSAELFDAGDQSSELYTRPELESIVAEYQPNLSALAYGTDFDADTGESIHILLSRGHNPTGDDIYQAWWVTARPGVPVIHPRDDSDDVTSVTAESFPALEDLLRNRESEAQLGTLQQLMQRIPALNSTIDALLEQARDVARQRFSIETVTQSETEMPAYKEESPHQETYDIPTVTDSDGLQVEAAYGVYAGDRMFLQNDDNSVAAMETVTDETCLQNAEHFIVRETRQDADDPYAVVTKGYAEETVEYDADTIEEMVNVVEDGGRYLSALYRDAYIEVIGIDAPFSYTMHVYFVDGADTDPHYLVAYDRHDMDSPLLEHPYALHTARFDSLADLTHALENPTTAFADQPGELAEWADNENVKELSTHSAAIVERMVEERGIPTDN